MAKPLKCKNIFCYYHTLDRPNCCDNSLKKGSVLNCEICIKWNEYKKIKDNTFSRTALKIREVIKNLQDLEENLFYH